MIFRRRGKHSKGFTLVEVIVVVAIIAVLATIASVSAISISKSSEKKAASTALSTYWNKSSEALRAINLRIVSTTQPSSTFIGTYLGKDPSTITVNKAACTAFGTKTEVYIQYSEDKTSAKNRYTVQKIWLRYKGHIYSTTDGTECKGPTDTPE